MRPALSCSAVQVNGSQLYSHELGTTGDFFILPKCEPGLWFRGKGGLLTARLRQQVPAATVSVGGAIPACPVQW